jgi:1-acyl-sn-glycerol-3-phosphate acyltransferase
MVLGFPRPIIMEAYTKIPVVKTLLRVACALEVPVPSASTIGTAEGAKATRATTAASDAPKAPSATAAVREKILEHKRTFQPGVDDAPIALFPEGITHNGRTILGFFPGAFEGGSSVQPVVLQYKYRHFNMHAFLSTLPEHLLSLFANPSLVIEVDFLPALIPNEAQKADGKLLADAARVSMARASGMALHEMSAKDLRDELKLAAEKARRENEKRLEKEKQKAAGARGEEPMLL